jgi:hypothetical protein
VSQVASPKQHSVSAVSSIQREVISHSEAPGTGDGSDGKPKQLAINSFPLMTDDMMNANMMTKTGIPNSWLITRTLPVEYCQYFSYYSTSTCYLELGEIQYEYLVLVADEILTCLSDYGPWYRYCTTNSTTTVVRLAQVNFFRENTVIVVQNYWGTPYSTQFNISHRATISHPHLSSHLSFTFHIQFPYRVSPTTCTQRKVH